MIRSLRDFIGLHRNFRNEIVSTLDTIEAENRDTLIVLVGEGKTGKSTARNCVAGILSARAKKEGRSRGCFQCSVPEPDHRGRFAWSTSIARAYADANEPLANRKIFIPPHGEGAIKRRSVNTVTVEERALLQSLLVNMREEAIPLILDEANAIPSTLSALQLKRMVHGVKDLIHETGQPLVMCGTAEVKEIVSLSVQLQLRAVLIHLDAYSLPNDFRPPDDDGRTVSGPAQEEYQAFGSFLLELEEKMTEDFCVPGCLTEHTVEILRTVDGRCPKVVNLVNLVLADSAGQRRLTWHAFEACMRHHIPEELTEAMQIERVVTGEAIRAAAVMIETSNSKLEASTGKNSKRAPLRPFERALQNDKRSSHSDDV
jgi:hypothetical protein